MTPHERKLHAALVGLGMSMGVRRYAGQTPVDAAHEFASKALAVIGLVLGTEAITPRREP